MKILDVTNNSDQWTSLICNSNHSSVFVEPWFTKAINTHYRLYVCMQGQEIVGGALVGLDRHGNTLEKNVPFTMYQGILLARPKGETHTTIPQSIKISEYIYKSILDAHGSVFISQHWRFVDIRGFDWLNYSHVEHYKTSIDVRYTAVLDLSKVKREGFKAWLSRIRKLRIREYNKGLRRIHVEKNNNVDLLVRLYQAMFENKGVVVPSEELLQIREIAQSALAHDKGCIYSAYIDNLPVSSFLFLYGPNCVYYLVGANDSCYRNSGASTFMMLQCIELFSESGYEQLDFVGANSPNRGDYKVSFNSEIKPYYCIKGHASSKNY